MVLVYVAPASCNGFRSSPSGQDPDLLGPPRWLLPVQVRAVPIRREDEVKVVRGSLKGREGKVVQVYRRKWVIHVERVTREKVNGATVNVGLQPSNCVITKLKIDKDRTALLERKAAGKVRSDNVFYGLTLCYMMRFRVLNLCGRIGMFQHGEGRTDLLVVQRTCRAQTRARASSQRKKSRPCKMWTSCARIRAHRDPCSYLDA
eukprot:scaffold2043_cov375-Prasinococcus_capsulatus_cf.AAC.5